MPRLKMSRTTYEKVKNARESIGWNDEGVEYHSDGKVSVQIEHDTLHEIRWRARKENLSVEQMILFMLRNA